MKKEIIDKVTTLIVSAFGLVAALAWNDTIKLLFNRLFGAPNSLWAMLFYAIAVTVIAVVITIQIGRMAGKKEEQTRKIN
jgi:ABC-type uncharacterized transport system fused permease/ATPase subunit